MRAGSPARLERRHLAASHAERICVGLQAAQQAEPFPSHSEAYKWPTGFAVLG